MRGKEKLIRITNMQKKLLIDYMWSHREFALATSQGLEGEPIQTTWETLQKYLADFGPNKSVKAWKCTWRDLKRNARLIKNQGGGIDATLKKLLCLIDETDLPMCPSESSVSIEEINPTMSASESADRNGIEDIVPKFITEQTSVDTEDPLSVANTNESMPEPENMATLDAPRESENIDTLHAPSATRKRRKKAEKTVFSFIKKAVDHPMKIIRIEIHDADNFPSGELSMCNCQAEVCVQYVVSDGRLRDDAVFSGAMELISKIQEGLETRLIET